MNYETITPEKAKSYLEKNSGNRKIRKVIVERYAREMTEGRWINKTGESIKFYRNGTLADGQHRLMAVIKSGVTIMAYVTRDIEDEAFAVIDVGAPRTSADVFRLDNIPNASSVTSIINALNTIEKGVTEGGKRTSMTNKEMLDIYHENPEYWDNVVTKTMTRRKRFNNILSESMLGATYVYLSRIDEKQADIFFEQLTDIYTTIEVIEKLKTMLYKNKYSVRKYKPRHIVALIFKTWNYFRTERTPKSLKYKPAQDVFPEAI